MIKLNTLAQPLKLEPNQPKLGEIAQRRLKLKKATEAFESVFITQLLKNMRSVSFNKKQDDGFGKDIMLAMADESVARQLSTSGMLGVGKLLYEHLIKRLEAEPTTPTGLQITSERHIDGIAPPRSATSAPPAIPATEKAQPSQRNVSESVISPPQDHSTRPLQPPIASAATTRMSPARQRLEKYVDHIRDAAQETNLTEDLIRAVIKNESGGDTTAVSPQGAAGLMQLMPDTARSVGVTDRFDPRENIMGGARYLRQMIDRFGDLKSALAAYNAGPGNVAKHGGVPPFPETQNYVRRVLADLSVDK